jgi:signal transduction histidine kinase
MPQSRNYSRVIPAFTILCAIFYLAATLHQIQKADVPDTLSGSPAQSHVLSIDGVHVSTADDIEFFLSSYRPGDPVRVELSTTAGNIVQQTRLVGYYPPPSVAVNTLTGWVIFFFGVFVYLKRREEDASIVYCLASATVAAAMFGTKTMYALHPWWLGYTLCVLFFFAYTIMPVLFLHFTFLFPAMRWRRFRRWLGWLYAVGALIAVWQSWIYLQAAASHSLEMFRAAVSGEMIQNAFVFLILLLSVLNFILSYKSAESVSDKKKLRWMLFGLSIGPTPFIFLWVLPQAVGAAPQIPEVVFKLILLLIPASFTISIVRYHLLDIDFIINRSAVYVTVIALLLAVYVGIIGLLATSIRTPSVYTSAAAAVVVALAFEPVRRRVQRFVDKQFFRVRYNYREAQRQLIEEIKDCLDVRQLGEYLVSRIQELIPIERIGFFVLRQPGHHLELLAHHEFDMLARHGVRFDKEHLQTDLKRTVALDESIEPGLAHESANAEVFRRWGMALVFPMLSEADEILGFLVLGSKKSGGRFTVEDVDLLTTVSIQAGVAMKRIALQQELLLKQEEARRLEELSQLKSFFVSSVSHDLKTPLTSIKMFAELLRSNKKLAAKGAGDYLEIIEGEADRLTRLINNVLDFAKMERGVKEYHFSEVGVNEVVSTVLRSMAYQFKMGKFKVHMHISSRAYRIRADADALAEAVINLLSNAMKYSGERKELSVSTFCEKGYVGVSVKDCGIGIPEDKLENIFNPFYRVDDKQTQRVGGVGLGLSIVKHVIDAHGGKIEVSSSPGEGSTFTLLFVHGALQ